VSMDPQLDRLGGCCPAEQRSFMCGSLAWLALGAQACGVNSVQGCADLVIVAQQSRDLAGPCISGAVGLGGMYWQSRDLAGLCRPWGCGQQSRDRARLGGTVQ
jgi:hypothetical protein